MAYFRYESQKLAYTIHGEGPRTTVLNPGLLLSQKMQTPLASALARRRNRVVTLDRPGQDWSRPEVAVVLQGRSAAPATLHWPRPDVRFLAFTRGPADLGDEASTRA